MSERLVLREALNVPDLKKRDALVRRIAAMRKAVMQDKQVVALWNQTHPNDVPLDTEFEDAVIQWLDGVGPLPPIRDGGQGA